MGNISNFNVNKIDMRLSNAHYWDLYLADGDFSPYNYGNTIVSGDCLVAHYDFSNPEIYPDDTQYDYQYGPQYGTIVGEYGESQYTYQYAPQYGSVVGEVKTLYSLTSWKDAINTGYIIPTIGLTGIDNGYLLFDKPSGDTTNQALLNTLTGTTLDIPADDIRLCLSRVSGMTGEYRYPAEVIYNPDPAGDYMKLCGGFYQGYYKLDGYDYQVLPNRVPKTWTAEVWLRQPCSGDCSTTATTKILNDDFPDNKGFFLYFGTRAENKFWNTFEGLNTGATSACTSGATEWCTIPKETDVNIVDTDGNIVPLSPQSVEYYETDNKFLFFSRAKASNGKRCNSCGEVHEDGETTCTWTGGTHGFKRLPKLKVRQTDDRNPFLVYSRASKNSGCGKCSGCYSSDGSGETICSFSGFTTEVTELDRDIDVVDNALGFRVTDDGAIGYRKLTITATCVNDMTVTGCTIEEEYTMSGVVTCDEWHMISIKYVADETLEGCELETWPRRKGKLMFYVNRRLIHVVEDFDEFIAKRLIENSAKQVAVPFNISLGGGTQGLLESMTFDGQDPRDTLDSCLTSNFAGSFIGHISQFRFYICGMNYCDIKNNFEQEHERYGLSLD